MHRGPARAALPGAAPGVIAVALAAGLALAGVALAQVQQIQIGRPRFLELRVGPQSLAERNAPPLSPPQQNRLDRARALRETGRLDAARDTLMRLLSQDPHHPAALAELVRVYEDQRGWRTIETLARSERAATRDSLLLAGPLTTALSRQGRPREAAAVVMEVLVADPSHLEWARSALDTLAAREPKGVRELLKKTAAPRPDRDDLARLAARLEWRYGDGASAMRILANAEVDRRGAPQRWRFAEEMLQGGSARDSAGAVEALLDLAGDGGRDAASRVWSARRAWEVSSRLGGPASDATRVARVLKDVPIDRWGSDLVLPVMRALRQGEATEESRALRRALAEHGGAIPEIALERALGDLREGPAEKSLPALRALADTLPEAVFRYAEALFFAGQPESASVWYGRASLNPGDPHTGAALERIFLLEEGQPRTALVTFGAVAYLQWRGDSRQALALADSLYRTLGKTPLWAHTALTVAALRERTGDGKAALEPLLAVAEGLPDDRLAPLARQRAGDVLRIWHKDDARALAQYEECLARYPKAWNTPEVRRWVETLRRERRF